MARQRRGMEMGVLLLGWQLLNSGFETFPPVTLLVMAGQVTEVINVYLSLPLMRRFLISKNLF